MDEEDGIKNLTSLAFSTFIGIITLIVTIIALIPAFLALNKETPDLYYSYNRQATEIPAFVDEEKFKAFLRENKIPSHRVTIQMKNVGNAPVAEIKDSIFDNYSFIYRD
jgi:hypothetical protein